MTFIAVKNTKTESKSLKKFDTSHFLIISHHFKSKIGKKIF